VEFLCLEVDIVEVIYFNKNNIKDLEESRSFEKFNEHWGITKLCNGENIFLWNGKKYKFDYQCFEPSVTMKCMDDDSHIAFGVSSELKSEFILVE
jgi:hypothetical protein